MRHDTSGSKPGKQFHKRRRSVIDDDNEAPDTPRFTKRVRQLNGLQTPEESFTLLPRPSYAWRPAQIRLPAVAQIIRSDLLPPPGLSLPEQMIEQWKTLEKMKYELKDDKGPKKPARRIPKKSTWSDGIDTRSMAKDEFVKLFLPPAAAVSADGKGPVCAVVHCQSIKLRNKKKRNLIDGHVVCAACWQAWHSSGGIMRNAALCARERLADMRKQGPVPCANPNCPAVMSKGDPYRIIDDALQVCSPCDVYYRSRIHHREWRPAALCNKSKNQK